MDKLILTPAEVSDMLRTSMATVQMLLETGEIPAYREGRNWKIPASLLKLYVIERATEESERRKTNG